MTEFRVKWISALTANLSTHKAEENANNSTEAFIISPHALSAICTLLAL